MNSKHPVNAYALQVVAGTVPACLYVRQACQRHLSDFGRSGFYFDERAADHVFRFCGMLKHIEGQWGGTEFVLEPFQKFILGSIFGWKHKNSGTRRYREAYLEVPRKNGKSFLCSAVALYAMVADGEQGAQVYTVATKREQAGIVWSAAQKMIKANRHLRAILTSRQFEIRGDINNSVFRALPSDSKKLDGLNVHVVIADEVHAWGNSHLYSVIKDSMGARKQPLILVITTAGQVPEGICYELRGHIVNTLASGDANYDDGFFGYISTIDEGDAWDDPVAWRKANPMLGVITPMERFAAEANQASKIPSRKIEFQNVRLNQWINSKSKWLDVERWRELAVGGELELEGCECYVGLDLSQKIDMTAMVLVFPDINGKMHVVPRFYLPEKTIDKVNKQSINYYRHWADRGYLIATPGVSISLDYIFTDLAQVAERYRVLGVAIDKWMADGLYREIESHGVRVEKVDQWPKTLSEPCKDLERRVLDGSISHDGNPIMSWNINNVVIKVDANGNIKPDKEKSVDKIDGVSALVTAMYVVLRDWDADGGGDYRFCVPGSPDWLAMREKRGGLKTLENA